MDITFDAQKTTASSTPLASNPVTTSTITFESFATLPSTAVRISSAITFPLTTSTFSTSTPLSTTTTTTGFSVPVSTSFGFNMLGSSYGTQQTSASTFGVNTFPSSITTTSVAGLSTTTGFTLSKSVNQSFPSSVTTTVPSSTTPATTVVTSSLPVSTVAAVGNNAPAKVNFAQLEENINKWTIELEEQEKVFMNQVSHINEWDRLLLSNGDKIVSLNNNVERVKLEQQQLDHELDFIVAQQRELEECLIPLEKEFADITVSDPERDATYRMAENLNTQLKHMSEDLKEIIETINEENKNQDTTDPIVQIGRILNAHMNSLQWVDQSTALIKQQLDQVTKLTEIHRRENDSTQNL